MARYKVQTNFHNLRHGELVDIEPAEWAPFIEAGALVPVDEQPDEDDDD